MTPVSVDKVRDRLRNVYKLTIFVILVAVWYAIAVKMLQYKNEADTTRMQAICPSLLSITRSSRDTLILMKAEPLCNNYVLENLK